MPKDGVYDVLFLCTRNAARSIIAEAVLNKLGQGKFKGYSAGTKPKGSIDPYALNLLRQMHYPVEELRSKSIEEFNAPGAQAFDFIITLSDSAAGEITPQWPGKPVTAHWTFPDPSRFDTGDHGEAEIAAEFAETYKDIHALLSTFVSLPHQSLDRLSLEDKVDEMSAAHAARKA
ncbi:arsenate reductase ArsC [Emcibacter sp. SYSU 3D8]|uniref:arsenate reductase ArsC n=1 Tax=Emcibacter sp. SYSU 3D8 TaxID=3133969 RepID=UPI0031FF4067